MKRRIHVDDLRFLGAQFKQAREALGLRRVDVVREAGYQNLEKGCRRLIDIERAEKLEDERVLERFAHVLDLDLELLWAEVDRREDARCAERRRRQKMWVGTLLEHAREQKGWTLQQVVEAAGLSPVEQYARRLERFEAGEYRFPMRDELEALCDALDVPFKIGVHALAKECDFYDRLDAKPRVVARLMPAVYSELSYPGGVTTAEVLAFAAAFSADRGLRVCVTFSGGRSVYLEPDGYRFESWEGPAMYIR